MHVLERWRFGWDTAISNYSWTLPLSQTPTSKPQLLTSALLWFIKSLFFLSGQVLQHLHRCWAISSLLLGTPAWTQVAKKTKLGWHCCGQGGQGTQGLLLHSAIETRTSFSWSKTCLREKSLGMRIFIFLGPKALALPQFSCGFWSWQIKKITHVLHSWKVLHPWDSWEHGGITKTRVTTGQLWGRRCSVRWFALH